MTMFKSILCFFLFLFFSPSCLRKKTSPYTDYNLEDSFRYPILSEPPTLDWNKSSDTTSSLIINNLMEGLTEYDFSKKNQVRIQPALAKTWTRSKNNKSWSFVLKKNIFWTDGKPLKAKDFLDGWERLLNPKTASKYAYFLFPIKNAKKYNSGQITNFKHVGVSVSKKGYLNVELEKNLFDFPYLLTHPSTFPIRKDLIESKPSNWTDPKNIITLGPYRLKKWSHDKALILSRNKNYHGKTPSINKLIFYIIPDETSIKNLYFSGRLDVATPLISTDLPFLKHRRDHHTYNILGIYYYGFNVLSKPLKDSRMRKAIAHAINRKEIVKLLNRGDLPLKSWIPQGLFAYNKNLGLNFNPKKSKQLMKKMGYKNQEDLPKIKIFYNTTADHKMIAENIQAQLKKNLGINIELNNQEWKTYLQRLNTKDTEIFRLGWLADYPDPDNFMNLMASFSNNNHTNWSNKKYDQLILKAMTLQSENQRKKLYDKAQKILLEEDVAVFPIYNSIAHILISPRIKNYPLNIMNYILFKNVEIKNKK